MLPHVTELAKVPKSDKIDGSDSNLKEKRHPIERSGTVKEFMKTIDEMHGMLIKKEQGTFWYQDL